MTRIIIFTGKGGVGKTSVAAAHALHSAKEHKKTLLISTDMAHNLSDLFEIPFGRDITCAAPNLDVLEIDPNHVMAYDFPDMSRAITGLLGSAGLSQSAAEQLTAFPGMDEMFSLLKLLSLYQSGTYERIMVDCAPTGETLSLLKFPELLSWYMEKFFPVGKAVMRVLSPVSRAVFQIELPDRSAMSDIEKLYMNMMQLQALLRNREVTTIRLVSVPEKMVVEETRRSYMYLNLYDYQTDGLFINRILPDTIGNPFFLEWLKLQKQYMEELRTVFAGLPIYDIPWFESDLRGIAGIERLEKSVFAGKSNVFAIPDDRTGERYEKTPEGFVMKLPLPFADKKEIDLHESGRDVIIRLGNYKRNITKPDALRHYEIGAAAMEDSTLCITFTRQSS